MLFKNLRNQMYEEMCSPGDILDFYKKYFGELLYKLEKIEEMCQADTTEHMDVDQAFLQLVEDQDSHDLDVYQSGRFTGMEDVKFVIRRILEEHVPKELPPKNKS